MSSSEKDSIDKYDVQENIKELGLLLQKKRGKEKSARVNEILVRNLTVNEKIALINEIDEEKIFIAPDMQKDVKEDYHELLKKENITDTSEAKRYREIIKAPLIKGTFLNYLFKDFRSIKEYSVRYGVYSCRIIPPSLKINKNITRVLTGRIQKDASELLSYLKLFLKEGWQFLSKKDYNLLYYFNELCKRIVSSNFNLLDYNDKNLIDKMKNIEMLLLVCCFSDHYPDIIKNSIRTITDRFPEWKYDPEIICGFIGNILDQHEGRISLPSIIVSLNIVKYRKYLNFKDLILSGSFKVISNFEYECDDAVKNNIKNVIDNNLKNLIEHIKIKEEIDKIKKYISYDVDKIDLSKLSNFYDGVLERKKFNFQADRENILISVQRYIEAFLESFEDILSDNIDIDPFALKQVKIFSNDFFQYELDRIKYIFKKLQKYNYSCPNFPYTRYVELKISKKGGTVIEAEILQIIYDFSQTLNSLNTKLIDIDRYHNIYSDDSEKNKNEPLSQAQVMKKRFSIPFYDHKISSHTPANDLTVIQAISLIITLNFLFNIYMYDKHIPSILDKESAINSSIKSEKEIIKRLSNVIELAKLKEKFNFFE